MHSKNLLILLSLISFFISNSSVLAEGHVDAAVSNAVMELMKELKFNDYINGKQTKRIAIDGFKNSCDTASYLSNSDISKRVKYEVQKIKSLIDAKFEIVLREDIATAEAEFLISNPNKIWEYEGPLSLLEESDILITGSWQDAPEFFHINLIALSVEEKGTRELANTKRTEQKQIKTGLPHSLSQIPVSTISTDQLKKEIGKRMELFDSLIKRRVEEGRKADLLAKLNKIDAMILEAKKDPSNIVPVYADEFGDVAYVDIKTSPNGADLYVDGVWVRQSPSKIPLETGKEHHIVIRGDPRYFLPKDYTLMLGRFEIYPIDEKLKFGKAEILFESNMPLDKLIVDGVEIPDFNPLVPVIEIEAGKRVIEVWKGIFTKTFNLDVWIAQKIRLDCNEMAVRKRTSDLMDKLDKLY